MGDVAAFAAYQWLADFVDEELVAKLLVMNLKRAGEEDAVEVMAIRVRVGEYE